jgi:predicted nucleotidyltransferase
VDRFLERVDARFPLSLAVLFGSRGRGDELVDSDYDLLVVSAAFDGLAPWDRIQACLDLWDLPEPLEVVPVTPAELERRRADLTIVGEALRTGRVLRAA